MAYDHNNVFARILRGEIPCKKVLETEHALAFEDISPRAPVHTLVIPKGAYVSMDDFSRDASAEEVADFVKAIGEVARLKGVDGPGYRLLCNIGHDGRQEVPHLHVHVVGGKRLGNMLPAD